MTTATASVSLNWGALKPYLPLLVALWIAEVTGSFEAAMILAAMRPLLQDFGDPVALGWLISTFGIVGAASAAVVGRLGDLFGRRRLLIFVLIIVFIGSPDKRLCAKFRLAAVWANIAGIVRRSACAVHRLGARKNARALGTDGNWPHDIWCVAGHSCRVGVGRLDC